MKNIKILIKRAYHWCTKTRLRKLLALTLSFLVLLTSVKFLFFNPKGVEAAWYSDSWAYRIKLTIDHTKVSGDQSNFPVLVSITNANLSKAQSSGNDIVFTDSTGTGSKLDHEIEKFTQSTGTLVAWVRIASLSSSTDTVIYLYYDNPSAPDQSNKTGVWDTNYVGVWHLSETSGHHLNSTSTTGLDSNYEGVTQQGTAAGKADGADAFNGTSDYVRVSDNDNLSFSGDYTVEAWVKLNQLATSKGSDQYIVTKKNSVDPYSEYRLYQRNVSGTNYLGFDMQNSAKTFFTANSTGGGLATGTWYHVAGTKASNVLNIYINGSGTVGPTFTGSTFNSDISMYIGSDVGSSQFTDGTEDEIRISKTARTAGWIATTYNTISSPSTFFTSGSEERIRQPVLYFGFDEGYGTIAHDSSTTGANGTISGATWQTEDQCVSGKCLYFNGSSATVTVATPVKNIQTVAFWIKPKTNGESILDLDGGTHTVTASGGTISANGFAGTTTIYVNGQSPGTLTANQWQYVEITTDTAFNTTASFTIGKVASAYLNGFIDNLKLYDYARTAAQVKTDTAARGSVQGVSVNFGPDNEWLSQGLVGYWKMDEATWSGTLAEVKDSSGNANDGQAQGATGGKAYPTTGKFGSGGYFDGVDDYITVPDNSSLGLTGQMTISIWIKPAGAQKQYAGFVDKSYTDGWSFAEDSVSGRNLSFWANNVMFVSSSEVLTDNVWQNAVFTYDGNMAKIYLNGALVASNSYPATIPTNTRVLEIGNNRWGSYYKGNLDDVRIYNRALSPNEVSQLYNWAPGPVAYWKLDENTGTSAYDSSTNGYTCNTYTGNGGRKWDIGKFGGGFGGDIYCGDISYLNNVAQFTYSAWYNIKTRSDWQVLMDKPVDTNHRIRIQEGGSPGTLYFYVANGANTSGTADSLFTIGQWFHVEMVYNGAGSTDADKLKVYINGNLVTLTITGPIPTTTADLSTIQLNIGNVNGVIDDAKIYNYARTPGQIVEDMNAGHPAPGSPVGSAVGYWKFDEGYGTTAYNTGSAGSIVNGTLSGSTLPTWTNNGKIGNALSFDGANSYVNVQNSVWNLKANEDITISAWINLSGNLYSDFENIWGDTHGPCLLLNKISVGNYKLVWSSGYRHYSNTLSYTFGTWYHVAVVRQGTSGIITWYRNGIQVGQETSTDDVDRTPNNVWIGNDDSSEAFKGSIDEVQVFKSALTADQIKEEYNQGKSVVLGSLSDTSQLSGGSVASNSASAAFCVPGSSDPCAPPVGYWKFDEHVGEGNGSTTPDSSGNNLELEATSNNMKWVAGKYGSAIKATANTFSIQTGVTDITLISTAVTISGWAYYSNTGGGFVIFQKSGSGNGAMVFWISGGRPSFRLTNTGGTEARVEPGVNLPTNQWIYLTGTWDGTTMKMYINGTLQSTTNTLNGSINNTGYISVNDSHWGPIGEGDIVDDVRVYDYARTPAQVAWDYNRGGPVGWWKMDEASWNNDCSTNTVFDSSGNSFHGISCPASTGPTGGATGKFNNAGTFDGSNDYVDAGNPTALQLTSSGSVTTWIKWSSTSDPDPAIVCKDNWSIDTNGYCLAGYNGGIDGELANAGQLRIHSTNTNYRDDQWHHVAFTWDGTWLNLYIDGVPAATHVSQGSFTPVSNVYNLTIGKNPATSGYYYTGSIDDVRIYNYALTQQQIQLLYNGGAAVRFTK